MVKKRVKAGKVRAKRSGLLFVLFVIASVLVVLWLVFAFSSVFSSSNSKSITANVVFNSITEKDSGKFILSDDSLYGFLNKSYDDIKSELGIKHDFVVHVEDADGNVVAVDGNRSCIGRTGVSVNGFVCG